MLMKRLLTISALLLLALSCGRNDGAELVEWTFDAPSTKASLSGDGSFSWDKGDEIAVWDGTSSSFVTFTSPSGSSRFSATAPANADFTDVAYFPASMAKNRTTVTLDGEIMPMYAAVEDDSQVLHFKHLTAYLKVQIAGAPASMNHLVLSSPTVSLGGDFSPVTVDGVKVIQAAAGTAAAELDFSLAGSQDITFTLPVPVGTYAVSYVLESSSSPLTVSRSTAPITFERAHLYTLAPATLSADGDFYSVSLECEPFNLEGDTDNWE